MPHIPVLKKILFAFFLLSSFLSFSQNTSLDSLETYTKRDTIRVNLLNNAGNKIAATDQDKALQLFKESESLAQALRFRKGKAMSLLSAGKAQVTKGDYNGALASLQAGQTVYEELKDKEGMANCYLNKGRASYYLTDFPKALEHFKRAIDLSEEAGKPKIQSNALMVSGMIYNAQGAADKSLEYYKKAMQIDERAGNKKGISTILINLGNLYKQQGDYTQALESYNRSLDLKKQLGDEQGVASNLNNIGTLYQEMEKNKEAIGYYQKALPIFEKYNMNRQVLGCLSNIGIILMHQKNPKALALFQKALRLSNQVNDPANAASFIANIGGYYYLMQDYDASLKYYEKAVKIQQKMGAKRELSYSYLNMGRDYYAKKEYDKALEISKKGMDLAQELNLLNYQSDFSLLLSDIYYKLKEYKLAYENRQAHKELSDSIYKKENIDKLAQIKYKYAYKDTLNSANKNVNSLKEKVAVIGTQRKWLLIGSICLLIVLGFVMALLKIRKVRMQNQQLLLEQKLLITQMNPHFIFNSIQNIQALIDDQKNNQAVDYLDKFSALTRQILEHSTQNYIALSEEIETIENYLVIQQLLYSNKFDYSIRIEDGIDTESIFLPPMLTQPFIENAIKHGLGNKAENGKVDIHFFLQDSKLFFEVSDNGKGFDHSQKTSNHKSLAMTITKERLIGYTKNQDFVVHTDNIKDAGQNVVGAKVSFEIPYIYEN